MLAEMALEHEMKSKANDVEFVCNNFHILLNETTRILTVIKNYLGD